MNKEEIINGGWLEAYLSGDVSKEEAKTIESFLENDEEVRTAYEKVEDTLSKLAFMQGVTPSQKVKKSIIESISNKEEKTSNFYQLTKYAAAASIIVTVSLAVAAFLFWNKWQDAETRYTSLLTESQSVISSLNTTNEALETISKKVEIATSPDYKRVILAGTDNAPQNQAIVFWNANENKVYLGTGNLGDLSSNQQYQLWALVDGVPIDAGVFDPSEGLLLMKDIEKADTFAVTIEDKGGSPSPNLSTLQVIGNVS